MKKIRKRNGKIADFEVGKIKEAARKALSAAGEGKESDAEGIARAVASVVTSRFKGRVPDVETVQNVIAEELMRAGFSKAARKRLSA